MFSGPMFRWEYQSATRKRRPFVFRTTVAAVLGIVSLAVGYLVFSGNPAGTGASPQVRLILFGRALFVVALSLDLLFLIIFVPAFVGGAIAEEREKDTLPLLLLTRLTPFEIVVTKTFARWLTTINAVLIGLPVLVVAAWIAGLERELVSALLVLLSTSGFMAILAIYRHRPNIQRLLAGTESRFGTKKEAA